MKIDQRLKLQQNEVKYSTTRGIRVMQIKYESHFIILFQKVCKNEGLINLSFQLCSTLFWWEIIFVI